MSDDQNLPESEQELYPVEPRYHPLNRSVRRVYDFLASARLAMFLLVVILLCCVAGVTIFRGDKAWTLIFTTYWFNGLLVALVVNVACCFFGRIWGRRITLISFGMILFHLSFVAIFAGIVYNSLFYFDGVLRLTEEETLPNGDPKSYDVARHGRLFNFARLTGTTTLNKLQTGYKVDGENKILAYDVTIADEKQKKQAIIYITQRMDFNGVRYFRDKEGFSLLLTLLDNHDREVYGAFVPLQSLKLKDGSLKYVTGSKDGPARFQFPPEPDNSGYSLLVTYHPSKLFARTGEYSVKAWDLAAADSAIPAVEGKAAIGAHVALTRNRMAVNEVRYWAAMNVRYDPGQPIVMTSFWVGLAGMIITTVARIMKREAAKRRS